jgi:hypothetical protein
MYEYKDAGLFKRIVRKTAGTRHSMADGRRLGREVARHVACNFFEPFDPAKRRDERPSGPDSHQVEDLGPAAGTGGRDDMIGSANRVGVGVRGCDRDRRVRE